MFARKGLVLMDDWLRHSHFLCLQVGYQWGKSPCLANTVSSASPLQKINGKVSGKRSGNVAETEREKKKIQKKRILALPFLCRLGM